MRLGVSNSSEIWQGTVRVRNDKLPLTHNLAVSREFDGKVSLRLVKSKFLLEQHTLHQYIKSRVNYLFMYIKTFLSRYVLHTQQYQDLHTA